MYNTTLNGIDVKPDIYNSQIDRLNQTIASMLNNELDIRDSYFRVDSSDWSYSEVKLSGDRTRIKTSSDGNIIELTTGKSMLHQFFKGSFVAALIENGIQIPSKQKFIEYDNYSKFKAYSYLFITNGLEIQKNGKDINIIQHSYPVIWSSDNINSRNKIPVLGLHDGFSHNYPAFMTDFYPLVIL